MKFHSFTSSRAVSLLLILGSSTAYRSYQDRIPNGDNIPHPCKPSYFWPGVGHTNQLGGGERNAFGQHFQEQRSTWTQELCRMDSDGDGMTNGQELGDPYCIWTQGVLPTRRNGITHPGVCDPWWSEKCRKTNTDPTCGTGEFVCDGLDSPDVFNITLRFPLTPVPAKETSYVCFTFELDMLEEGVDYHLIATAPYIDNPNVMHQSVLTSCDTSSKAMTKPEECNMGSNACQKNLAIWRLGMAGECVNREAGFRISRDKIARLTMKHHWTNPELRTDYVDSSGLILYFTRKLRKYNAAYFTVGNIGLEIPPGENRVVETSTCSSECTRKYLKDKVYLMTGWNHMQYLGYQQKVEHIRDGMKLRDLTPHEVYSYDNPVIHVYDPVVELRPGDKLETTCRPGNHNGTCYSIFTYFPAENIQAPLQACQSSDC